MFDIAYMNEYTTRICSRGIMGIWYVAREYYEENSFGEENGMLRGIIEMRISDLWLGNILVIVVRGQLLYS